MKKLGYLGPEGSFSHIAVKHFESIYSLIPYKNFYSLLYAVENNELDATLVPIENSIEGSVNMVLDLLAFEVDLYITEEILLSINHHLLAKPHTSRENIKTIISHPQALGQCRKYLYKNFPNTVILDSVSTSAACEVTARESNTAAIANDNCAEIYHLEIIERNIQDYAQNQTRFVLLQKNNQEKVPSTGKTSLIFSTPHDPGSLYQILNIFALWNVSLSKIESRPSKNKLGEYIFFTEIEGTTENLDVTEALRMIRRKTNFYKFLGSYKTYRQDEGKE